MKNLLKIFFLVPILCFSQKIYEFDHRITYQFYDLKDPSRNAIQTLLTNSEDNNYYAKIKSISDQKVQVVFYDRDKIYFNVEFKNDDVESLNKMFIDCEFVMKHHNPYKDLVNHYQYVNKRDTLINGEYYKQYLLHSDYNLKTRTKKKIGKNLYIIENNTSFHLPILTHDTAFEEWKSDGVIPNGIYREKLFINPKEEIAQIIRLVKLQKEKSLVIIPKGCKKY